MFKKITKDNILDILPNEINIKIYKDIPSYNVPVNITKMHVVDIYDEPDLKIHEWIDNKTIIKPYYDIDYYCATESEMEKEFNRLLNLWIKELCKVYECESLDLAIAVCNRYKEKISKKHKSKNYIVSFHIIVNSHFTCMEQLKIFNETSGLSKMEGFDNNVYKNGQNFRIVGQSKPEPKSSKFMPYNYKEEDEFNYHIIQVSPEDDTDKMKKLFVEEINSPAVSPPTSDDEKIFNTDISELKNLVLKIKTKYGYDDWIKMAFIINHETGGSEEGYKLFLEWSKLDEDGFESEKAVRDQWNKCKNSRTNGKKVTMGTLKTWYYEEYPNENKTKKSKNPYKDIYYKNCSWNDDDKCWEGKINLDGLVELMNKELIFVKETGETIVLDGDEKWYLKKPNQLKELFSCFIFKNIKNKDINPADLWLKHIDRRQVIKIGFDPKNIDNPEIFNIWKGLKINETYLNNFDTNDAKPIIDHIFNIWCSQNQEYFDYVMNWFAHILQFPYKKTGVVVCLKSNKEGAGKGIIMNKLRKIIGDNHYFQCNNLDQLTGSFNGVGEAKILINLDEAFWGKDKKKEGMLKNIITEETKFVNKKNKESYIIEDYCNYIISTNNDCFIPASEGGRRFFALDLDNQFSGVQNENKKEYFKNINEAPAGAFAKYLFERDISTFNPREFKKTKLLQEQIQHNWCSVRKWWFNVLQEAGFKTKIDAMNGFVNMYDDALNKDNTDVGVYLNKKKYKYVNGNKIKDENGDYIILDEKHFYKKEFIYDVYTETCDGYKLDKAHFWENMKRHCLNGLLSSEHRFKGSNQRWMEMPDLTSMRNKFNELQDFDYEYCEDTLGDDWE
tara:strand:- start:4783 stop:7305 length:2523 start_codon:yes stop_codon:yes gene_type:complete